MNYETVGNNIKKYRKHKKLTQAQLAAIIEKSEISVRKYEKGDVQIPNNVLDKIAKALDINLSNLLPIDDYDDQEFELEKSIEWFEDAGYSIAQQDDMDLERNELILEDEDGKSYNLSPQEIIRIVEDSKKQADKLRDNLIIEFIKSAMRK